MAIERIIALPLFLFHGACALCGVSHDRLPKCSKCQKLFHPGSCGVLPIDTEYERADPDDLLRGMSFGGKKERPDYKNAVCGLCVPFPSETVNQVREELPPALVKFDSLKEQLDQLQSRMDSLTPQIVAKRDSVAAMESDARTMRQHLHEVRQEWTRVWNEMVKRRTLELSSLEQHVKEHGQALAYEEHRLTIELENHLVRLKLLEEEEAKEIERFAEMGLEFQAVSSELVSLGAYFGLSERTRPDAPYYARTPPRRWY